MTATLLFAWVAVTWLACGGVVRQEGSATTSGGGGRATGGEAAASGATSAGGATDAGTGGSGGAAGAAPCPTTCGVAGCCVNSQGYASPTCTGDSLDGMSIVADPVSGDIVVMGQYSGSPTLGTAVFPTGPGAFVARFDRAGQVRWARPITSSGAEGAGSLGFSGDDIIVAWGSALTLDLGCGALTGAAIGRLAGGDGHCLWTREIGNTIFAFGATMDPAGDVLVAGDASMPSSQLPCGATVASPVGWVAKLSAADGTCQWTHTFPGDFMGLGSDAAGGVYVSGSLVSDFSFAGKPLSANLSAPGAALLLRYAADGTESWGWVYDGPAYTEAEGIAVTSDQRVWIAGQFGESFEFAGQTFGPQPEGVYGYFVAGFTADGAPVTATAFTSTKDMSGMPPLITADHAGGLVVSGNFNGDLVVGAQVFQTSYIGYGIFLVDLDPAAGLSPRWARSFGDGENYVEGVTVDACGQIVATGSYLTGVDFGCGPLASCASQLFIARFAP